MTVTQNKAIITLVTSEDFVIGAQVMVHSLITNNPTIKQHLSNGTSDITTAVLVTPNISNYSRRLLLSSGFDQIIAIDPIPNPNSASSIHVKNWIHVGFTKIRIWSLTQFEKILYIDADCVIVKDITHLLTHNKYKHITFAAAPDVFPPDNFNAGVLLIKPNINTFNILLKEMPYIASYDGGDTGFLNKCTLFNDWYQTHDDGMMRLSFGYNAQRIMHWFTKKKASYWTSIEGTLNIIHYSSSPKPWNIKPSQRIVDRVEIIWNKYWIALNEQMNKNQNKKIALNHINHIVHKTNVITHKYAYNWTKYTFDELMTRRRIQFGRICDKDNAVRFEKTFLMYCKQRFEKCIQYWSDNVQTDATEFVFNDIPKIIHQIWLGPNTLPQQYKKWSESWIKLNPNWKYMVWTEKTLKESAFEWGSMVNKSLYELANNYGEKSDIVRLEILYQFGGIYVDFDFECIKTLDVFVGSGISCFFGLSNTGLLEVNNAIIGCRAGHEILRDMWKSIQIVCNDTDNGEDADTIIRTGPIQLTRCIMNMYSKYNDILIFPTQCFYPFPNNMRTLPIVDRFVYYNDATFAVHHWGVSWSEKHRNHVTMNEENEECKQMDDTSYEKTEDTNSNINIIESIMNTSNNIALQSKIMSFLQ